MLRSRDLSYRYKNGLQIHFPDILLDQGKHCLLLGESGTGKTTLLHLLGGLLKLQHGEVAFNETSYRALSESEMDRFRGQHVGFIFQKNHLVGSLNVTDNLLLAPFFANATVLRERAYDLLERLGMAEKKMARISSLSQGQLQRVAIARAVINKPSVILADEPTSALDDTNCKRVVDLLLSAASEVNASLLIATHDHRLTNFIHNQVVLKKGQ